MSDGALTSSYTTPPNVGTAGSTNGGSLTQGAAMPNITTTQSQATAAPSWYTDYLQNIAGQGQSAAQNAQFVGPTAMQNQSYDLAQQNVGNWQPAMSQATGALGQVTNYDPTQAGAGALSSATGINAPAAASPYLNAGANANVLGAAQPYLNAGTNPTYNTVNSYMSPYVNDVVGQIGNLAQQNLMQNVAPQTSAGLVGSGQFGSQRGAQALGQTLANYGQQTTAAQVNALNTGYQSAMTQAGADATRQLQAGQTAGTLAQDMASNNLQAGSTLGQLTNQQQANLTNIGQVQGNQASQEQQNLINAGQVGGTLATATQNLGLGDVNALSTLGTQQQQIQQAQQLFPMQMAQSEAGLLQGAQIPTSASSAYTGPIPGAYQTSPLSQITGIGSLLYGAGNVASGATGTLSSLGQLLNGTSGATSNPLASYGGTVGPMGTSGAVNNNPFPTYSAGDWASAPSNIATDVPIQ